MDWAIRVWATLAAALLVAGCVRHISVTPVPSRERDIGVAMSAADLRESAKHASSPTLLEEAVSDQLGLVLYAVKHRMETGHVPADTEAFVAYLREHGVERADLVRAEFTEEDAGSFAYRLTMQHALGQSSTEGRFVVDGVVDDDEQRLNGGGHGDGIGVARRGEWCCVAAENCSPMQH